MQLFQRIEPAGQKRMYTTTALQTDSCQASSVTVYNMLVMPYSKLASTLKYSANKLGKRSPSNAPFDQYNEQKSICVQINDTNQSGARNIENFNVYHH